MLYRKFITVSACMLLMGCLQIKKLSSISEDSLASKNFSFSSLSGGGVVNIPSGTYEYDATLLGELQITNPIKIFGSGKNKTKLKFKVRNNQASIRILASNVEIANLEIEVEMIGSFGVGGGRAEYGTGITAGMYLQNAEHDEVSNINLHDLSISRVPGSFVATAITLIGRVSFVNIENIDILENTSKLVIMHWGGYTDMIENIPAPEALERPEYALVETYHPHNINISNVNFERAANLFIISSSYNINIEDISGGQTSDLLYMLPGDEINDLAVSLDKQNIGKNITLKNIDFDLKTKADANAYVVRLTSFGASILKKDENGNRPAQELPYDNVLFENIKVNSVTRTSDAGGTRNYRFGINAQDLTGSDISFVNIDLNDVGSSRQTYNGVPGDSFAIYLRNSEGLDSSPIVFDGIFSSAQRGVGIIDSRSVIIKNSQFNRSALAASSDQSSGVYFLEKNDHRAKVTNDIEIRNSLFGEYTEIIRYPPLSESSFCSKVNFTNISHFVPLSGSLERDNSCL